MIKESRDILKHGRDLGMELFLLLTWMYLMRFKVMKAYVKITSSKPPLAMRTPPARARNNQWGTTETTSKKLISHSS